jgi:glutamyl-tRNA synthetase
MTLIPVAQKSAVSAEQWVCSSCRLRGLRLSKTSFSTYPRLFNEVRTRHNRQAKRFIKQNQQIRLSSTSPANSLRTRDAKLPSNPARTRFAPSPTGYLHIGGLRTALFSYLLAKRTSGQFLLRIEDTDQKRLVPDAESRLLSDLQWAGLQWDEGPGVGGPHGPYRQSERTESYRRYAEELLRNESAYRCFCSLQAVGNPNAAFVTSGCYQDCASLSRDESQERAERGREAFTVRLRVPADAHKRVYPDLVYGRIQRLKRSPAAPVPEDGEVGVGSADTILLKSDGTPTYHFANVVDDHLMQITHVIRGVEWVASTPLHYDIYSAFNWTPPQFAHVGLLVDQSQAKLSKRNQDMALDVASMREIQSVLPETLVNFLALLGWSNPIKNDVMDMQALISNFDLKFTRGNAMVRTEKLWYLQRKHVATRIASALQNDDLGPLEPLLTAIEKEISNLFQASRVPMTSIPLSAYVVSILMADSSNYENAAQWVHRNRYFFTFDASQIPSERESYSSTETITAEDLRWRVLGMARVFEELVLNDSNAAEEQLSEPEDSHERGEKVVEDKFDEDEEHEINSPEEFVRWTAKMVNSMRELRQGAQEGKHELEKPLMKFLREKIAMGLPGPSIDTVMALLGPRECARRLRLGADDAPERRSS